MTVSRVTGGAAEYNENLPRGEPLSMPKFVLEH